jgi:F-type H+-transporting ATPase subunit delta
MTVEIVARPYAKATFEFADATHQLDKWFLFLSVASQLLTDKKVLTQLDQVALTIVHKRTIVCDFLKENLRDSFDGHMEALIHLLIDKRRLVIMPAIFEQFSAFMSEKNKTLVATVNTFTVLNSEQQNAIVAKIEQRFHKHVILNIQVDETLLGGYVVQVGDEVIDASIRTQLKKLHRHLIADN